MEVLTITQAAQLLQVSRRTIERLRLRYYSTNGREGLGPWMYLSGVRIERAAVERCAARSARKAARHE
jgi:excisionase family DNA binding protein